MKPYLYMKQDEIQKNIPYQLVAETFAREVHKTGKGKRIFNEMFAEFEKESIRELRRKATKWAFQTGAPRELKLTLTTLSLWMRLADYCMRL